MAFKLFRGSHDFCPSLFITSTYSGGCEGKILPVLERLPAKLAVRGSLADLDGSRCIGLLALYEGGGSPPVEAAAAAFIASMLNCMDEEND